MFTVEPSLVVRFIHNGDHFEAIIEEVQGLHFSPPQTAVLSVNGATLREAYNNFKKAAQRLQRERKLPPGTSITFKYLVLAASKATRAAQVH